MEAARKAAADEHKPVADSEADDDDEFGSNCTSVRVRCTRLRVLCTRLRDAASRGDCTGPI